MPKLFRSPEMITLLVYAAIVVVIVCGLVFRYTGGESEYALKAAREYARHVPGASDVRCNAWDTDGDGYVSCTIFRDGVIAGRDGTTAADTNANVIASSGTSWREPLAVECGLAGCRAPKARVAR